MLANPAAQHTAFPACVLLKFADESASIISYLLKTADRVNDDVKPIPKVTISGL